MPSTTARAGAGPTSPPGYATTLGILSDPPTSSSPHDFAGTLTDHAPTGPDYFFPDADVDVIVESLNGIKRTAVPEEVA